MQVIETEVVEIIRRTEQVLSLRMAMAQDDLFQAGQFCEVTVLKGGAECSRYLSFSSSPTEKGYVEFTKRLTGSDFSGALACLQAGDRVRLKLPLGKFVLDAVHTKYAFLAGGIGITPIRSIWKYAFDRQMGLDMVLLYSNRSPEDIIFRDDFADISKKDKKFKVVFSLDRHEVCPIDWRGRCGFIDAKMIREEIADYKERIFYVCGPIIMVKKMVEILQGELGVTDENIRRENIAGY